MGTNLGKRLGRRASRNGKERKAFVHQSTRCELWVVNIVPENAAEISIRYQIPFPPTEVLAHLMRAFKPQESVWFSTQQEFVAA